MREFFKRAIICGGIFTVLVVVNMFMFFKCEKTISKQFMPPLYIIENKDFMEMTLNKSILDNYTIVNIDLKNLNLDKYLEVSKVNERFLVYEKLINDKEYEIKITLENKKTNERYNYNEKFIYVNGKIDVSNIYENYCNVKVSYDRKNSIFIDGIEVHSQGIEGKKFKVKKNVSEINEYRNRVDFKEVSLVPNSTNDIYSVISLKNNINLVYLTKVKSKEFNVVNVETSMVSNKKIKVSWKVSNEGFKLVNDDSIKIYVKSLGEVNYAVTPDVKITENGVFSTIIDTKEISPKYEVKVEYNLLGSKYYRSAEQENDYYGITSKVNVSNLRSEKLNFGINIKDRFVDDEILNIYLVDKANLKLNKKQIYSHKLSTLPSTYNLTLKLEDLKPEHEYKVVYEIIFKDGNSIIVKEDEFKTLDFKLKSFNAYKLEEKDETKIGLKWNLDTSKFNFIPGDTLSVYIKRKTDKDYSETPYVLKDKDLDKISTFNIGVDNDVTGEYDIKLVYNIGGKEYVNFQHVTLENISTFGLNKKEATPGQQLDPIGFRATVLDTKANEVIVELAYPKEFEFTEGDIIKVYTKLKESSGTRILNSEYVHVKNEPKPEEEKPQKPNESNVQTPQKPEGHILPLLPQEGKKENENKPTHDVFKKNLKNLKTITVTGLIPEKKYEFEIEVTTKNNLELEDAIKIPRPHPEEGTTLPENGEGEGSSSESNNSQQVESGSEETEDKKNGVATIPSFAEDFITKKSKSKNKGKVSVESKNGIFNLGNKFKNNTIVNLASTGEVTGSQESVQNSGSSDTKSNFKALLDNIETKKFEIKTFTTESVKTNTAILKWTIDPGTINFNKNDKIEIYAKRKIVGGYPAGNLFQKVGSEMNGVLSGEIVLSSMKMDYNVKLVYIISGVKYEKTLDLTTLSGTTACSMGDITEYSAKLNIVYPEGYKFSDGDAVEIFIKEASVQNYPTTAVMVVAHTESNKLENFKEVNLQGLYPKMNYDVLVTFSNDVPNCSTKFTTKPLLLDNCVIKKGTGDKLLMKTSMKNDPEILEYIDLYLDIFYKPILDENYLDDILASTFGKECLETEFQVPDRFKEYTLLASFNPHGFFSDSLFIEFENEYKVINGVVDETTSVKDDGSAVKNYDLKWAYPKSVNFGSNDKIDIYIKEIMEEVLNDKNLQKENDPEESSLPQDVEIGSVNSEGYTKIHTIESELEFNTSFNLNYFVGDNKKYSIIIDLKSEDFKFGPGKVEFKTSAALPENENNQVIFEVPIQVEDFEGAGDQGTFKLPDLGKVVLNRNMPLQCDIEGLSLELEDEKSEIKIKGLVPGKNYEKIEVKVKVEEGKEITFNIENIKLKPEDNVQEFLFNTYQRAFVRDPDEGGYHYWIGRLKQKDISARNFIINLLFSEKEFSEMKYTTEELIGVLYSIVVDREPDKEGLGYWINFYNEEALKLANNDVFLAKKYIVDRMINEEEFKKLILSFGLEY